MLGNEHGRGFRDRALEEEIHKLTQNIGIGAQFGGRYFCHDVRVIRLPRHGASCPVGIGVSCSADRQVSCKALKDALFNPCFVPKSRVTVYMFFRKAGKEPIQ